MTLLPAFKKSKTIPREFKGMVGRQLKDRWARRLFLLCSAVPLVLVTSMIVVLFHRAQPILNTVSLWDLLSGTDWHPQRHSFGYLPFILGTCWVTFLAMAIAIPPSLLSAIFLSEYAIPFLRNLIKPLLDILAGIPSVVYGVWGMISIVPWIRERVAPFLSELFGGIPLFALDNPTGYSILAGGVVLAVMVTPVIISICYEVLETVPNGLRHSSLALGATKLQTVRYAVLRKAAPGILAACMMAFSRAFGETMAVMMVVGNVPLIPSSIFDPAYPLPALIANNYGEMLSIPLYDAALMGAALLLLVIILLFNILSAVVLRRTLKRLEQ